MSDPGTCPTCGHVLWPTDGLTPVQRDMMLAIESYVDAFGCAPSLDNLADLMNRAKSGVHRVVTDLEKRGYISRMPYHARSIEILRRVPRPDKPIRDESGQPLMEAAQ